MLRILITLLSLLGPLCGQGGSTPYWRITSELVGRSNPSAAYDEVRDRVVMFGGDAVVAQGVSLDDTWEWDGTGWYPRRPAHSPAARSGAAMAFDPVRRKIILYGGWDAMRRSLHDMWEWDGDDWRQIVVSVTPNAVFDCAVATDPVRRRVVLFGGLASIPNVGTFGYDETWEWDGQTWHRIPTTRAPWARYNTNLAYSSSQQRMVLYGGLTPTAAPIADRTTWEWDGTTWWPHAAYPVYSDPTYTSTEQQSPILFPEPSSGRVRLHGYAARSVHGVYEWGGSAWTLLNTRPYGTQDSLVHADCARAFDTRRSELVAFGGNQGPSIPHDSYRQTWIVDSSATPAWRLAHQSTTTRIDGLFTVAYDAGRDEYITVLRNSNWPYSMRTYRLPGEALDAASSEVTGLPSIPPRVYPSMCYDPVSDRLVMFGGRSPDRDDTWLWDGRTWTEYQSATRQPTGTGTPVFHPGRGEIVVPMVLRTGSVMRLETWTWSLANGWRELTQARHTFASNLGVESGETAAYDPATGRIMVMLYVDPLPRSWPFTPTTWSFDGSSWRQENPSSGVTPPGSVMLVPELGGVVSIVQHDLYTPDSHQIWRWTGNDWSRIAVANWPGGNRYGFPIGPFVPYVYTAYHLYDSARGRVRIAMYNGPGWLFEDLIVERLTVNSIGPRLGSTWTATVREPAHSGGAFFVALSAGQWPAIPVRLRPEFGVYERFPLANDWLFQASAAAGLGFGGLDANGTGSFSLQIPNLSSLIGFRFHAAAITVAPQSSQLGTITNAVNCEIQR